MSYFTDGSRRFGEISINSKFRLPYHCTVFQAEVAAIKVSVDLQLRITPYSRVVTIRSDSRAAILALELADRTRLMTGCPDSRSLASTYFMIIWKENFTGCQLYKLPGRVWDRSFQHFLLKYSVFASSRLKYLWSHTFLHPSEKAHLST